MIVWLRRHPVAAFLPLQAVLYLWNLSLLSPWMDEAGTLLLMRRPLDEVLKVAAMDVHPPLYYLLLYVWQRLPLGLDWAVQARMLSVIFALMATVALDRLWASRFSERTRITVLALWTLSPCLLLYARMCRSYSLQALWAILATAFLVRFLNPSTIKSPVQFTVKSTVESTRRNAVLLTLALLGALYSHYAAGIALIVTVNLGLWVRRRWQASFAIDAAIAVGYLPWILPLGAALGLWSSHAHGYALTGSSVLEAPVKLAYWALSFVMGEAAPDAMLLLGGLLIPVAVFLVWKGARGTPELAWIAGVVASIGFLAVARLVSYPFTPARLLFVLPFFLLLLARGAEIHPHLGNVAIPALLLLSLCGIVCYFQKTGFRNKQYPVPIREIASEILHNSRAEDSAILVDSTNSDPVAMTYQLHGRSVLETSSPGTPAAIAQALADPRIRTVWFLRNTHDVSPEHWNALFDAELRHGTLATVHLYEPYSRLERYLMHRMNSRSDAPQYFQELIEYRR